MQGFIDLFVVFVTVCLELFALLKHPCCPIKIANKIWFSSNRLYGGHHIVYRPSTNRTLQLELIGTNLFQHDKDLLCVKWAPWRQVQPQRMLLGWTGSVFRSFSLDVSAWPHQCSSEWTQIPHRHTITSTRKLSWRIKGIIKPKREPWKCSWI